MVTGGNAGIGKETVKALLAHSAKVYIGARSQERVEAAINDLKKETGKEALFLKLDLSDLKSVETAATEFLRRLYNASMIYVCQILCRGSCGNSHELEENAMWSQLGVPRLSNVSRYNGHIGCMMLDNDISSILNLPAMGVLLSTISELLPPKSKFSAHDIPDLEGKVMVVTGANTGIGKETAKALLGENAKMYIAARSHKRAKIAIEDLKLDTGSHISEVGFVRFMVGRSSSKRYFEARILICYLALGLPSHHNE